MSTHVSTEIGWSITIRLRFRRLPPLLPVLTIQPMCYSPAAAYFLAFFFGRPCASWHRLQRVFCELIFPPHFGHRRLFSFIT